MKKQKSLSVIRLVLVIILLVLIAGPILAIFARAIFSDGQFDLSNIKLVFTDTDQLKTIGNSLLLGVLVVIVTSLISFPIAYLTARTEFAKYKFLDIIFMIPFMTPPYIASMGWILFMQRRGLLQQMLAVFSNSHEWFFSLAGLVMVMSFNNYPFMVSLLRDAMVKIPSSLEESAAVSGAGFWKRLTKVIFPVLKGNYAIAALLVFVRTISEYGAPATLGARFGFDVFTTAIHRNATVAPINFGASATLSVLLTILCLVLWLVQNKITRSASYNLVGARSTRLQLTKLSPLAKVLAWVYIGLVVVLSIGVPYFSVIVTSLIDKRGRGLQRGNFTLRHYKEMFTANDRALNAIFNSLWLALVAALICVVLGVIIVTVTRKRERKIDSSLEFMSLLPEMLPGIVIVIGLMIFWNKLYKVIPVYNSMWMLIIAYVVLFLPYTINYVSSAYTQIGDNIMEAARVYGANKFQTFRKVSLPLISNSITTSWMMTFIIGLRELVASSMVSPPGEYVISTFIQREFEQGSVSTGMAMATITVILTTVSLIILNSFIKKKQS